MATRIIVSVLSDLIFHDWEVNRRASTPLFRTTRALFERYTQTVGSLMEQNVEQSTYVFGLRIYTTSRKSKEDVYIQGLPSS
jgi:hypothetical protein